MPECAHGHLMLSSAVINWPIKRLAFRGAEVKFRGRIIFFVFRKQRLDGGNGEISVNPKDQCRVCNCSFEVKFIFLILLKGRTARVKFWSFSSKPPESWIQGGKMWQAGYLHKVKEMREIRIAEKEHVRTELKLQWQHEFYLENYKCFPPCALFVGSRRNAGREIKKTSGTPWKAGCNNSSTSNREGKAGKLGVVYLFHLNQNCWFIVDSSFINCFVNIN